MAGRLLKRFLGGMQKAALMVLVLLIALGLWAYFGMDLEEGVTPIQMVLRVYTSTIVWLFCGIFCVGAGLINLLNPDEADPAEPEAGNPDGT